MIKNIVFDMGQVLNRVDPEMFLDRAGIFGEDRDLLRREVFHGDVEELRAKLRELDVAI